MYNWNDELRKRLTIMDCPHRYFAERCGITPVYLSYILTGKKNPSVGLRHKMTEVLLEMENERAENPYKSFKQPYVAG